MRTGGEILADMLIELGVDTAFGVPGESYLALLDALHDREDRIRTIMARHEGGASFMAAAHGRLTGRPGVCMVTRGPGATNASIGVHTAMQESTPMILLIGQVPRQNRYRESFQEIDYRRFFGDIAKWVVEVDDPGRIPELVGRAYQHAVSGRPGPVVLALPEDVLSGSIEAATTSLRPVQQALSEPGPSSMEQVRCLLQTAERPLILAGGCLWSEEGRQAIRTFAERNLVPVVVGFRCQDLIDNSSPAYAGDAGVAMPAHTVELIENADVILAVGTRFDEITAGGFTLFNRSRTHQKIIHVHPGDMELGKITVPVLAIQSGPEAFWIACEDLVLDHGMRWREWYENASYRYRKALDECPSVDGVDLTAVVKWLSETLPNDAILTTGAGNFAIWPARYYTFQAGGRFLAPVAGAMGYGVPAAVAAKIASPDKPVVCFAGDGDFLMTGQELGTAVQHELPLIVIVCNNGMYGTIRMHQEREYPERVHGTDILSPDFVALGKAYGAYAERVQSTEDFPGAFLRARESGRPALLELVIDPDNIAPGQSLAEIRARQNAS